MAYGRATGLELELFVPGTESTCHARAFVLSLFGLCNDNSHGVEVVFWGSLWVGWGVGVTESGLVHLTQNVLGSRTLFHLPGAWGLDPSEFQPLCKCSQMLCLR